MNERHERLFQELIHGFERNLSRVLAAVLVVVLMASALQLILLAGQILLQPGQDWLDGQLIFLLDRLLLLLIGLEVLQNLTAYLRDHRFQTELVVLTALTAVARKVIVMPPSEHKDPLSLLALGVLILCLAGAYQLLQARRNSAG
jgi:uncharacterized membrane protein (DUF373 family)